MKKRFLPEVTGLTLSGKLGRRSSWCWGRTATRRAHLAGGASVWPWTTSWWTLGRSGVPESGTATPPRWRSPWSQQPPRWSSAWGGGSKWSSRLTEETLTQLDITYLRVDLKKKKKKVYLAWLVIRLRSSRRKCGHICECWKSTQEFNSWRPHRFGKLSDEGVQTLRQFYYHSGDGPLRHCQVGACSTMQNVSHVHHCVSQLAGTRTSIINHKSHFSPGRATTNYHPRSRSNGSLTPQGPLSRVMLQTSMMSVVSLSKPWSISWSR